MQTDTITVFRAWLYWDSCQVFPRIPSKYAYCSHLINAVPMCFCASAFEVTCEKRTISCPPFELAVLLSLILCVLHVHSHLGHVNYWDTWSAGVCKVSGQVQEYYLWQASDWSALERKYPLCAVGCMVVLKCSLTPFPVLCGAVTILYWDCKSHIYPSFPRSTPLKMKSSYPTVSFWARVLGSTSVSGMCCLSVAVALSNKYDRAAAYHGKVGWIWSFFGYVFF